MTECLAALSLSMACNRNAMCTSHFGAVVGSSDQTKGPEVSDPPRVANGTSNATQRTSKSCCKVRTTHVTGTLTDIGSILGRLAVMYLRRGLRSMIHSREGQASMNFSAEDHLPIGFTPAELYICTYLCNIIYISAKK